MKRQHAFVWIDHREAHIYGIGLEALDHAAEAEILSFARKYFRSIDLMGPQLG